MAATKGSALWERAMSNAIQHEQWPKFQQIAAREKLIPRIGNSSTVPRWEPHELVDILNSIKDHAENEKSLQSKSVRKIGNEVLTALDATKELGSGLVSLNPYAALGWGVLQGLVQIAVRSRNARKLCWDTIEPLTLLVTRYQTFESTYVALDTSQNSQTLLENSLCKLFTSILNCQFSVVVEVYSKTAKLKASLVDASNLSLTVSYNEIKRNEDEFFKLKTVIERGIDNDRFQHLSRSLTDLQSSLDDRFVTVNLIANQVQSLSTKVNAFQRSQILNWISPIKYESTHNKPGREAYEGTADWLFQHQGYLKWSESARDSVFWLRGFMGSGKTCVTHAVVTQLLRTTESQFRGTEKIIYFYCDGTNAETSKQIDDVANIMRCLLKQLADNPHSSMDENVTTLYEERHHKSDLSTSQCTELISTLVRKLLTCFIVVDGLDECPREVQADLIDALQDIKARAECPIKLFISSRDEVHIHQLLSDVTDFAADLQIHNQRPLNQVIRNNVQTAATKPLLRRLYSAGNANQTEKVIASLQRHANGMFRWADIALAYLHSSKNYHDMSNRLAKVSDLGGRLFDLYTEIWDKEVKPLLSESRAALRAALLMLLYGLGMPWTDLSSAGHLEAHDYMWSIQIASASSFAETGSIFGSYTDDQAAMGGSYSIEDIASMCPSLIGIRFSAGDDRPNLYIPHVSVNQFLVKEHADEFSPRAGHAYLSSLCMQFFLSDGPISPLAAKKMPDFGDYAYSRWMSHLALLRATGPGSSSVLDAVKQDPGLEKNLQSFLLQVPESDAFIKWNSYPFRHSHHLDHVASYFTSSFHSIPASSVPCRVALNIDSTHLVIPHQNLDIKCLYFLESFISMTQASLRGVSPLALATIYRSIEVIEYLLSQGADINESSTDGKHLGEACIRGPLSHDVELPPRRASKMEILMCLGRHGYCLKPPNWGEKAPDEKREDLLATMFSSLTKINPFERELFDFLVTQGYDLLSSRDGEGYLSLAIEHRCNEGVEILAPLWLATTRSQEELSSWLSKAIYGVFPNSFIQQLLKAGADPSFKHLQTTAWHMVMHSLFWRHDFADLAALFTANALERQVRLCDPGSSPSDGKEHPEWSSYFHKVILSAGIETVKQWVSDGWSPNASYEYAEPHGLRFRAGYWRLYYGTFTAYGVAQVAKRVAVLEFFDSLGVEIHYPTVPDYVYYRGRKR